MDQAFTRPLKEILLELDCSAQGLSSAEARKRLLTFGPNQLQAKRKISPWRLLLEQFQNVLIVILLLATAISTFLGHIVEAITIAVIVLFAVLLGFIQEYRAEKAIEALKKMAAPTAKVIRDGQERLIASADVVPGDLFLLAAGDRIPADARLIEAVNLQTEEASLTGESLPSEKDQSLVLEADAALGDRRNMVFAGTSVCYGRGRAVAVATGMDSEFGKIASMLQQVETERTPLQRNLDRVGSVLARAAFVIVLVIMVLGLLRGQEFIEMLIFAIALAVAVVPEALPAVVTISLALGVKRMVKRHALMRHLPAVETLGSTTVICSDKTGTLTRDEMTVRSIYVSRTCLEVEGTGYIPQGDIRPVTAGQAVPAMLPALLEGALQCNDSRLIQDGDGQWAIKGDPTEGALRVVALKAGIDAGLLDARLPRIDEQPFSSETKRMITLHADGERNLAFIKGAPEVVLADCAFERTDAGIVPLDPIGRSQILDQAGRMAEKALRVLAIACKPDTSLRDAGSRTTFLGLMGMIDPPRIEAEEAVRKCLGAGIRPVMITGDHPITARAIARELGILTDGRVVVGTDLQAMSDETLRQEIDAIQVFARVAPEHKLRIVQALQHNGHIVAMTGDGVNDAPALKKANIGISMGVTGTDVTKEASEMMLTDDNFASIVAAVEEGRGIFENIKKYLGYLLSANMGEIGLMAGASLLGMPLPLSATQILYVNLATDGLPALALSVDPPSASIMRKKPNDPRKGIFTPALTLLMLTGGLWSTFVNLALFQWARMSGRTIDEAMTMTFVTLILIEFCKAFIFRTGLNPIHRRPFANKWLNLAMVWELSLMNGIIYLSFMHRPFGTFALTVQDWLVVVPAALTIIPVVELAKLGVRNGWFGFKAA